MGSLSDFSTGAGTSVASDSPTGRLASIPTGSMRAGDLAYVNDPTGGLLGANNQAFAFVPWSKTAVAAGDVYYADVANSDPLKAGRWHRVVLPYAVAPTP